jgi:hypothetical protein|uniref:Uncharacterized protein n=1 Tax=viral metagenome TaxID=1070528 RepID=A0A6C0JLG0_9ZZZZ
MKTGNTILPKYQPTTIDEKHTEMLERFKDSECNKIPVIEQEITMLKDNVKKLNENQIEQFLEIRDKIKELKTELKFLKNEKKNYLLDNSKYIFQYFEQKQQISNNSVNLQSSSNVVNSFFKIKSKSPDGANLQSEKYSQSKKAYQNYWRNVGNDLPNIQNFIISSDVCEICQVGEMIPQDEEGILICNNQGCGKFITYIVDSSKPTNKEPPNEVSYTAYIRLNHFKEILSQFQAKETTQIPEEVINAIKARIKKERIKDMSLINYDKMRDILRKLGLNKYFEHIQYINSLFGIKPPIMNEELHETLCVLFIEIQKPWAVHCPANRTNFFNYTYTLYQLCVLLDQTQYLPYIPMMKDREKQLEQDMIWKKVCNDLDWEYFPSV